MDPRETRRFVFFAPFISLHGHDAILIEVEYEVARRHLDGAESVDHGFTDHVRFLRWSEGDDGRAGAADGRSVGAGIHRICNDLTGARDKIQTIRDMDTVVEAEFQILGLLIHEGSHQEGNGTDIMHGITSAVCLRKHGSGFFRVKLEVRDRDDCFPVGRNVDAFRCDMAILQKCHAEAA